MGPGVEGHVEAVGPADHVEVLGEARDQPVELERRRSELEDERPQLGEDLVEDAAGAGHVARLEPEPQAEQRLGERVVELAGEPVALLEHRQLAAGLVEPGVLDEHRGVGGEVARRAARRRG